MDNQTARYTLAAFSLRKAKLKFSNSVLYWFALSLHQNKTSTYFSGLGFVDYIWNFNCYQHSKNAAFAKVSCFSSFNYPLRVLIVLFFYHSLYFLSSPFFLFFFFIVVLSLSYYFSMFFNVVFLPRV